MSWFDEQIRERELEDQEAFTETFRQMAGSVTGKRIELNTSRTYKLTEDAVDEILEYYHVKSREVPDDLTEMDEILEYLLRPHNIMKRTVKLEKGWYRDAVGAMLGTRKDDHSTVALLPSGLSGYRFYDRKAGRYVHINRSNADLIEPDALAFYKPFPLDKMNLGSIINFMIRQISLSDAICLVLVMAATTLVGMLLPRLNSMLFSDVLDSKSLQVLLAMGVFFACVTLSRLLLEIVNSFATARITTKVNIATEAATMMRVLSLPAEFFKGFSPGELASRVGFMSTIDTQLVNMVTTTGFAAMFSIVYVAQIFLYAPALVVPAISIILLSVAVSVATMLLQVRISKKQLLLQSKENGISYSMISGMQKIRLAGAEKRMFSRWGETYSKSAALAYNPPLLLKISGVLSTAISLIGTMVIYFTAMESHVSVAEYYAFNTAFGMISGAVMSLAGVVGSAAQLKPVLELVKPLMDTKPEIDGDKMVITGLSGGIELNNVTFRYTEEMPAVLDDLSLKINPGEYVAVVGKTGCGKSTLLRILLGFEKPQRGAVYYDGHNLKTVDPKSLRRCIGTVMQNSKVFMGDIFSNIVISAPWLSLDDAWEAAEIAGLADDIRKMPMGMYTTITEGQGGISGGQRQRLMIARAVAPKPNILMFDEATSALDNITQKHVSEALDRMHCTRLVIAHRLSTIKNCDRILVLDQGHIIEEGSYEELIARNGFFAELVERQRLDK
ncbi:MAG: NHLP bacteriocin export ABC transporter permease/ATPase subunit [Lachnospiraceae bacterium]|nr:NHLP bacteriocin export ABC transporter permease/ATPase subunit [Lachnospiraceae bacterium]